MKRAWGPVALAALVLGAAQAAAFDPEPLDVPDPPEPPGAPAFEVEPDEHPFVVPDGIHYVTETYTGQTVTTEGRTTTYATSTIDHSPGTWARAVDTVTTGAPSAFDGRSFNGRTTMADGTRVAGTYYENFVLIDGRFVSVSYVFFQDDSLTTAPDRGRARATESRPADRVTVTVAAATTETATTGTTFDVEGPRTVSDGYPLVVPVAVLEPDRVILERGPVTSTRPRGGVAPAPGASSWIGRLEVLRGRATSWWLRAADERGAIPVRSWRLVSGGPEGATRSGSGSDPFVATWLRLAPAGTAYTLRFELVTDEGAADATVDVVVRSPALVD